MSSLSFFFHRLSLSPEEAQHQIQKSLGAFEGGELFLEHTTNASLSMEDGIVKNTSFGFSQGFGLRGFLDTQTCYAHGNLTPFQFYNACSNLQGYRPCSLKNNVFHTIPPLDDLPLNNLSGPSTDRPAMRPRASAISPSSPPLATEKIDQLHHMDAFARALDGRVHNVRLGLSKRFQHVGVVPIEGTPLEEVRSLTVLMVHVTVCQNNRYEKGVVRTGFRGEAKEFFQTEAWKQPIHEALRLALVALDAVPAPAGDMPVILGPGTPGILLHEAIGHGFEADLLRKDHSIFSEKMGQKVASSCVTIVDNGHCPLSDAHGTSLMDDEGTATQSTTLVYKGEMVGHMSDRLNAQLMKKQSTGNGRRQSYAHIPRPRMTNTYMEGGSSSVDEIFSSVKRGIYAAHFTSGQVDTVSGDFVFSAAEAYLVENGKITAPLKGAIFTGNGGEVMKRITHVDSHMKLDEGPGYCGKMGQTVIVGLGQPCLLVSKMTVGGTSI